MRHLVLNRSVVRDQINTVAELGPGDSLGIGLAALLSGAERYLAFDAVPHAKPERNVAVFDELVELFRFRSPIPDSTEFPNLHPTLENYAFPSDVLTEAVMTESLSEARVSALREDLVNLAGMVTYQPQWQTRSRLSEHSVDLIVSQAVLEHVDALEATYETMFRWLKPGGAMSHQIDFKCHSTADSWNGHLAYSDTCWRLMRGNLPYFINRRSPSEHVNAAQAAGFQQIKLDRVLRDDGLPVTRLAERFREISALDVNCSGAFMQAIRPRTAS